MSEFKPRKARCLNCGEQYIKIREDHKFHHESCRKQFNKYGLSWVKVQDLIQGEVKQHVGRLESAIVKRVSDILRKRGYAPLPES